VTRPARRGFAPATAALAALLVPSSVSVPAFGQDQADGPAAPTRAEFVAQADPICREGNRESRPYFRKVARKVRKDELPAAGRNLIRAERIQIRTGRKLAELEPPPADADRIDRWLTLVRRGVRRAIASGQALKRGDLDSASELIDRADRQIAKGRRQVRNFDFEVCA
jgi:hypothetical protein